MSFKQRRPLLNVHFQFIHVFQKYIICLMLSSSRAKNHAIQKWSYIHCISKEPNNYFSILILVCIMKIITSFWRTTCSWKYNEQAISNASICICNCHCYLELFNLYVTKHDLLQPTIAFVILAHIGTKYQCCLFVDKLPFAQCSQRLIISI